MLITKPLRDVKLSVQYFDGVGRPVNMDYVKDAATISTTATATTTAVSSGEMFTESSTDILWQLGFN